MLSHVSGSNRQSKESTRFKKLVVGRLLEVKGSLCLVFLCLLGTTITTLLSPWPLKIIFDYILLDNPLPPSLFFLEGVFQSSKNMALLVVSSFIAIIAISKGFFFYIKVFLSSRIGHQIVHTLRVTLFTHLQQLSLSFHSTSRSGELLTKITSDTKALKDFYTETLLDVVVQALTLVGMFVIMFSLNWQLSAIIFGTLPVVIFFMSYYFGHLQQSTKRQRTQEGKIASQVNEILMAIPLVQAFGQESLEQKRIEKTSACSMVEGIQVARTTAAAARTVELIGAFGRWAVVCTGSFFVLKGQMTPGEILIFASYVTKLYKPIQNLAKISTVFTRAMVSTDRLSELLEVEPDIHDYPLAIRATNLKGDIVFDNVTFGYQQEKPVLRQMSFHITPGQRVALVGPSGAGKSTIANLILRLYEPETGTIAIDGIVLENYQRQSLRQQIGLVLQESFLFGMSVKENIAYGKHEATQEEIEHAAHHANAHDLIMALPNGYDTILGERGNTLSGGQRQRICLARAFVKQCSILILDEPISALDAESAELVRHAIFHGQEKRTTLFIVHQFSSMDQFDQILVIKDGHIVECGSHEHLLDVKGHYQDLFQRQIA